MKKAQAMLDALMGPSRNSSLSSKNTSEDWRDRKVCKTFLVAVCPYDKTMLGGRKSIEVCPKIHNEALREAFKAHADGAPDSRFRRDCEDKAMRDLLEAIAARDVFAREQLSHKNAQLNIRPTGRNKEIGKMKRQVCEIKEKADLIDDTESIAAASLKEQLLKEYATGMEEYEAFVKEEERKAEADAPRAKACKVCGTAYVEDDDYNLHVGWTRHTTYLQIEEHLEILRKKKESRDTKTDGAGGDNAKNEKPEIKGRSKSRDKDKAKEADKEKDKVKDADKRTGGADNDDAKNGTPGKKRSRSREKDRARDKDRNGDGRGKESDRRRRDRSRSRGARRRSRSRSRSRRRDGGRRR